MNKLIWFIVLALLLCGCGVPSYDDNLTIIEAPETDCKPKPKKDKAPETEEDDEPCSN
jgi:hypothetical protein